MKLFKSLFISIVSFLFIPILVINLVGIINNNILLANNTPINLWYTNLATKWNDNHYFGFGSFYNAMKVFPYENINSILTYLKNIIDFSLAPLFSILESGDVAGAVGSLLINTIIGPFYILVCLLAILVQAFSFIYNIIIWLGLCFGGMFNFKVS